LFATLPLSHCCTALVTSAETNVLTVVTGTAEAMVLPVAGALLFLIVPSCQVPFTSTTFTEPAVPKEET
jgi:hypothetical protein